MGAGVRACVLRHVVPVAHLRSMGFVEIGPAHHCVQNFHRPDACQLTALDCENVVHRYARHRVDAVLTNAFETAKRFMSPSAQGITQSTYGQLWPCGSD